MGKNSLNRNDYVALAIVLIASCSKLLLPSINSYMLLLAFPFLMICFLFRQVKMISKSFVILYIVLSLWFLITSITSIDSGRSLSLLKTLLGGFIISYVLYYLSAKSNTNYKWILISYVINFISMLYYIYKNGFIVNLNIQTERFADSGGVNANELAYYLFYITIVLSILTWKKDGRLYFKAITYYVLLAVLSLVIGLVTASRQILIIVFPFLLFSIVFRVIKTGTISRKKKKFIVSYLIILITILLFEFSSIINGSFLQERMSQNVKEDVRAELISKAIEVGATHPIFGVGPSNFALFSGGAISHCSYTELFATTGIVGMMLFLLIIYIFLKLQYRRYKISGDVMFLYLFFCGCFWALYNFLYVFYISPWLIAFLFLLFGYSERLFSHNNK